MRGYPGRVSPSRTVALVTLDGTIDWIRRHAFGRVGRPLPGDRARADTLDERPLFLTVTRTVGMDAGHTDVSLWFLLHCPRETALRPDAGEFHRVRWWTPAEIRAADSSRFPRESAVRSSSDIASQDSALL